MFKLGTPEGVIYFRAKSQSICDTWVRALQTVVANFRNPVLLASLPPFDGGIATQTRRMSIAIAINRMHGGGRRATEDRVALGGTGRRGSRRHALLVPTAAALPGAAPVKTHGRLAIRVMSASNLLGKDRGGTSDPYCIVRIDGYDERTPVFPLTCEPEWNHDFDFAFSRSIM